MEISNLKEIYTHFINNLKRYKNSIKKLYVRKKLERCEE